jgi:DNA-binding winged helix-turn-helix (wHTH) protein
MAILVTTEFGSHQASWKLGADEIIVGRSSESGLCIDESFVSRQHAVISSDNSIYSIRDLGSKNGTWVNDQRIGDSPVILENGDLIHFGNLTSSLSFMEDDRTLTLNVKNLDSGLRVDMAGREVYIDGSMVIPRLSKKEFDILSLLWEQRKIACSRIEIIAKGWPERQGDVSETEIEQYIRRLRRRIGDTERPPKQLVTVRGYGYKLL